jgi:hypothetical protein
MKVNIIIKQLSAILLLLMILSCKKYGYHFENGYDKNTDLPANVTVDTTMGTIDRSKLDKARIFPGLVDTKEPRVKNEKFTLDLNFSKQTAEKLRISVAPRPQFSTGYYAAPGELIKIEVPAGINGLSVQVGGHTDDLTGQIPLKRDPMIYTVKQLFPGANYVRNLYGGPIYINATFSFSQPVEFAITGAVVSPDFVLGKSVDAEWIKQVKNSSVPWLEMRTKRVVFLIPRDRLVANFASAKPLTEPTKLMTEWNNVFELDYNLWMGLTDDAADELNRSPQAAWREVLDIQPSVGYGHSGFPTVATNDSEWFNSVISLDQLLNKSNWGTYHEFGHNCQQNSIWSWGGIGETSNNLFAFKVAKRNNVSFSILHGTDWVAPALQFAASSSTTKVFDSDPLMSSAFHKLMPFLQVFERYGYGAMPYLYTAARHAPRISTNDIDKHDFVYERFSEYAKTDLISFFNAWGISTSPLSRTRISSLYPPLATKLWTYDPMTKTGGTLPVDPVLTVIASSEALTLVAPNGRASALVDANTATYWQSSISPAGVMPYNLVLNVGAAIPIKGLNITPSSDAAKRPRNVDVYYSDDNVSYTLIGTKVITNGFSITTYTFPATITARYFKIVIKDNYAGTISALSEISVVK